MWKQMDWILFGLILLLIFMGFINLYSISRSPLAPKGLFLQQMIWCGFGFALFLFLSFLDLTIIKKYGWILYLLGIILLVIVLLHKKQINGASRWLFFGDTRLFQPSEFAKLGIIFLTAKLFSTDSFDLEFQPVRYVVAWYAIWIIPALLIRMQPDLGTALICVLLAMSLFLLIRIRPTVKLAVIFMNLVFLLILLFGLTDYQKKRFWSFLNPEQDTKGIGWQIAKAKLAIGNGQMWGSGYLKGFLYRDVPEVWSDFPFAAFAEEWGFVGCLVLFFFYMLLLLWILRIANEAKDRFSRNIILGCASLLFWHIIVNIGMVIGLAPVVGVTLPLFSHGGSSLLVIFMALGLCMNVSIYKGLLPGK